MFRKRCALQRCSSRKGIRIPKRNFYIYININIGFSFALFIICFGTATLQRRNALFEKNCLFLI